jgi:hypothetical protein
LPERKKISKFTCQWEPNSWRDEISSWNKLQKKAFCARLSKKEQKNLTGSKSFLLKIKHHL